MGAQLWCPVLWWTLFAGSWWLVGPACGETQGEQLLAVSRGNLSDLELAGTCGPAELLQSLVERISEILTIIDVDDDGASCDAASARVVHAESSSGSRIWTRRRSASDQQSRDSSSSERHSESHRWEKPWSSEGIHWPRGGFTQLLGVLSQENNVQTRVGQTRSGKT